MLCGYLYTWGETWDRTFFLYRTGFCSGKETVHSIFVFLRQDYHIWSGYRRTGCCPNRVRLTPIKWYIYTIKTCNISIRGMAICLPEKLSWIYKTHQNQWTAHGNIGVLPRNGLFCLEHPCPCRYAWSKSVLPFPLAEEKMLHSVFQKKRWLKAQFIRHTTVSRSIRLSLWESCQRSWLRG